ncbi:hypothetical protein TPA0910_77200 [Streptomyces hygroscopicus subsp. sporocinereus]|uniref:Uncharacterized protein n=1 Tax=Streptomyces hygroscopicus TaxID=1912 RepID=A0ABQ3UCF2_STRHY|nr:hypothetical protein TPA0910_77200 [Streptomyces hygroscopicus]
MVTEGAAAADDIAGDDDGRDDAEAGDHTTHGASAPRWRGCGAGSRPCVVVVGGQGAAVIKGVFRVRSGQHAPYKQHARYKYIGRGAGRARHQRDVQVMVR